MRVLVSTVPGTGHVDPLLPIVHRLHEQGDEIIWATGPDQCKQLGSEPFEKLQVCPPLPQWMQQLASRTRGRPFDLPATRLPYWAAPRLFGEVGLPFMLDGLLAHARERKPDVVLFDSRCYVGPLVARAVAFLEGRCYVTPQDTKKLGPDVLRRRLPVSHEAKAENIASQNSIQKILGMLRVCCGTGNLQTKDLI